MLSVDEKERSELVGNLSILFVEDDMDVRESMTQYLARRVGKVHSAHNGIAGLDSFRQLHPDLVISDIRMPGMDGLTMCREIRATKPDIPVIIISAHNESNILLSSIDLGITKFIVKPVDTGILMESIASVALSLDSRRKTENRLRQMDSIRNEDDYDNECVKNYVSRYMEGDPHDQFSDISHLNIPKLDVSGDFYSFSKRGDDLYVMLADGAGHGLSAVLPALQMPGIFQQHAARGFSLLTIASEINRSLHAQHFAEHFVATTLMRFNQSEQFIEVLNCSNPPVLIFGDDKKLLHVCSSKSTALGMVSEDMFSAEVERFSMGQNANIFLFTDGLVDTLKANSPDFDNDLLLSMFGNISSSEEFEAVSSKIYAAAQSQRVDDVTLLRIPFDCHAMPLAKVDLPHVANMSGEAAVPVQLNRTVLLYVEDDEQTRQYFAQYLYRYLGMVHVAKDGKEGLELFMKHRPQIVLSDIKMPYMDGLEMAVEIRKLDKDVPIIVTSGEDNAQDAEKMFELGISRFHTKPLDPNKLLKTFQTCLQQANTLNQLRLSSSAFHSSSLAVITADQNKRIVNVNPSFTRITGFELEELQGQSPTLLSSGKYETSDYQTMWRALAESDTWSGELPCQHKNGTTLSGWLTVNAVRGADGALTGYHFIFSDISERQMNEEKARKIMSHDSLTLLPNRTIFAENVHKILSQSQGVNDGLALVYFTIDRFVEINSMLGMRGGEQVLIAVAQKLLANVGEPETLCHMGGDAFAILIREAEGRDSFERSVTKLTRALTQITNVNGKEIQLSLSVGISEFPSDGGNYDELVKNACSAMNQAQHAGGDQYRFFDREISQNEERQVALQQGIKNGLHNGEFFMLFQPKFSLGRQQVVGAEALVRWNHPTFGLISPVEFIPLAERNGAVIEMSEWIIDTVCAQLDGWRKLGLQLVPVAINISPLHFWRGDLVGSLQKGLQKWDISTDILQIEVTENVVMDTSDRTLQVLGRLKALGFKLSIDDFGTGYSSLKYLKDLPISELKIDRSFIVEIPGEDQPEDLAKTAIPRAIIRLAREFNLALVAEGVETESQKNFLVKNGCDVIQGYLFSPPISASEFGSMLH